MYRSRVESVSVLSEASWKSSFGEGAHGIENTPDGSM